MNRYHERLKPVLAHIDGHLAGKINLEQLAELSGFSKYHFARVFAATVGQPPLVYINARRLHRAASLLAETDRKVLDIALSCGFESVSNFSAAFRRHYGMTPGEIRKDNGARRKIPHESRKIAAEDGSGILYAKEASQNSFIRRMWSMNIELKELPDYRVAYARHVGSYLNTGQAWDRIGQWASARGLFPPQQLYIGVSLDDPASTEEAACRYDACITLPDGFAEEEDGGVRFRTLKGGLYGKYDFYDTADKLSLAYQNLYGNWLPGSEYDPDDRDGLEVCLNNPAEDPEGRAKIELYIPVRPKA